MSSTPMKFRSNSSLRPKRLVLLERDESGVQINRSPGPSSVCRTPSSVNYDGGDFSFPVLVKTPTTSTPAGGGMASPHTFPLSPTPSRSFYWPVVVLLGLSFGSILALAFMFKCWEGEGLFFSSSFSSISSSGLDPSVRVFMAHREARHPSYGEMGKHDRVAHAVARDASRIRFRRRAVLEEDKDGANLATLQTSPALQTSPDDFGGVASTVESGVSLGSGEYLIDVYIGTPPKHFSLIIDTGSDLNWLQCLPCTHCYPQFGAIFNPAESTSYSPIPCADHRCNLVYSSDKNGTSCADRPCRYFYNYGDSSNTTGDLVTETFALSLEHSYPHSRGEVGGIIMGCGHNNQGLFRGAGGLLGLGKGPLSFASQLHHYGNKFSYCLVDRNNNMSVSSVLVFGEDKRLSSHLEYCSFVANNGTFYYVEIESVVVGGKVVNIPTDTWQLQADGTGGTIVDSGTTLTYFARPAYDNIRQAFADLVTLPRGDSGGILDLCYDLSEAGEEVKWPEMSVVFKGGAVWKLPTENYIIELFPERHVTCLAVLGTPASSISILGNLFQQNFHVVYDLDKSRLGFAPMPCHTL